MTVESVREEARRTGWSKSTIHRRRQVEAGKVDPHDRYAADAKEAAVLMSRLRSRLARDSRYPFACPREVRAAIESIRFCVDLIGLYVGEKPIRTAEQAAAIRAAADDPTALRRAIANLIGGGYIARDELLARDLGLHNEQLNAFLAGDDTHLELIQLCYRRWMAEAIPDHLPPSEQIAERREQLAQMEVKI
jgi:hypothetical protein